MGDRDKENVGLTLWSVNKQSLEALVCANFNGPIGGLAQHGGSYSVKVKSNLFSSPIITKSQRTLMIHNCGSSQSS